MLVVKIANELYELLDWVPPSVKPNPNVLPSGSVQVEPAPAGAITTAAVNLASHSAAP